MELPANANPVIGWARYRRTMQLSLRELRPQLVTGRIFLLGPGVSSIEKTGASYGEDAPIKFVPQARMEPYATYWAGSGKHLVSMGSFSGSPDVNVGQRKRGKRESMGNPVSL
ncbi:hypothetical protein ACIGB6_12290 [Paeniglutamicibacter gangotriensis]|uniref:hypothetical protein n=1 Tax=Paeniglutamicibacter gangotriensis TaxID=254787 RepID=UPI0037C8947F